MSTSREFLKQVLNKSKSNPKELDESEKAAIAILNQNRLRSERDIDLLSKADFDSLGFNKNQGASASSANMSGDKKNKPSA
jgi:hypothetical protein